MTRGKLSIVLIVVVNEFMVIGCEEKVVQNEADIKLSVLLITFQIHLYVKRDFGLIQELCFLNRS